MVSSRLALLGDLLLIAEKQLDVPAERLLQTIPILSGNAALATPFIAFEAADPPLGMVEQAAAYGGWIACNKPFPRDNREIGYAFMRAMLAEAEKPWPQFPEDAYVVEARFEELESETITLAEFVDWACLRVRVAEELGGESTA